MSFMVHVTIDEEIATQIHEGSFQGHPMERTIATWRQRLKRAGYQRRLLITHDELLEMLVTILWPDENESR